MRATRELIDLITYGREERHLEYKGSMDWEEPDTKAHITRCILGMANLRDDGFIVLGVEQRGDRFEPVGMQPSHAESFSQDNVAAYVNERADPFVEIYVNRVSYDGKEFLVIQVKEFATVPIICKKEIYLGGRLCVHKGAICARSTRIPETVEVPSQTEMREIIGLAVDKEVRRLMGQMGRTGILSVLLEASDTQQYDEQLGDMLSATDVKERMDKIESTGYWRVNIRPIPFERLRIKSILECWELVKSCSVYLRGWIYPAVLEDEMESGREWVQCGSDYNGLVELWRFYQSGQFIDYFSCMEEYRMDEVPEMFRPKYVERGLEVLGTLYRITEIFEFSARLAQKEALGSKLQMSITWMGMKDRDLFYADRMAPISRVCRYNQILFDREFSTTELMANATTYALDAALEVYGYFYWEQPPRQMLAEYQQAFLEKRSRR